MNDRTDSDPIFSSVARRARGRAAAAFAGIALLALTACSRGPDRAAARPPATTAGDVTLTPAQRAHIELYTVAAQNFRKTIVADGTVAFDGNRSTTVLAPFSGPVARLLVSTGDRVAKGAPLAIVDSPDFAAAVGAYRKALAAARTARRLADLERDLLRHHGISEREEDRAQADAAGAEADRYAALQALVALGANQRSIEAIRGGARSASPEAAIRAPLAGTIVERSIHPGELLQAGSTPCFLIADLARVWVEAQIFGADVDAVRVGDPAEILAGSDLPAMSGAVTNVASEVDPATRSVVGRITVANPHGALKRLMYVRVLIHSRHRSRGLLIPVSAVLRDSENLPFVYVLAPDGAYARRTVKLGYRSAQRYQIAAGLRAGDRVVADGALFLQFIQNQ